ncbi:MAG TPA: RDD family protein [Chthoniobacterales bacterium]|nr:RDD family protein [Chthoniobacterales bacterium]
MAEPAGQALPPPIPPSNVAGFWRRLLGFFLDTLLLSVPAFVAGVFLFDQFAALGNWGRLVGLVIALVYFGVLNSSIGGGQTVGKRCFRTRTVDNANHSIDLGRSILRFNVIALPFFLNGAPGLQFAPWWVLTLAGIVIFGFGGTII